MSGFRVRLTGVLGGDRRPSTNHSMTFILLWFSSLFAYSNRVASVKKVKGHPEGSWQQNLQQVVDNIWPHVFPMDPKSTAICFERSVTQHKIKMEVLNVRFSGAFDYTTRIVLDNLVLSACRKAPLQPRNREGSIDAVPYTVQNILWCLVLDSGCVASFGRVVLQRILWNCGRYSCCCQWAPLELSISKLRKQRLRFNHLNLLLF